MKRALAALLFAGIFLAAAQAQPLAGQGSMASPTRIRLIKAARLLDVTTGTFMTPAVVVVEGDRIKAIGPNAPVPNGAEVIDLGNATLLPGLIDTHTHLLLDLPENSTTAIDLDVAAFCEDTATRSLRGVRLAREMLNAGFTAVRDLGNAGANGDVALREAINAGWVQGPRMQVSTRAISPIGGQMVPRLPEKSQGVIDTDYRVVTGAEEARRAVRQAVYDGADWIKVIVADTGRSLSLGAEEMKAIVDEAHRAGVRVAAHAVSDPEIRLAVEAGVDSIEHGWKISTGMLDMMASKKIWLVPTDWTKFAFMEPGASKARVEALDRSEQTRVSRLRYALKVGVRVASGSDVTNTLQGRDRGRSAMEPFRAYKNAGLPSIQIIRMATIYASELMGLKDKIGSIEVGKLADMIAVPGDPLADIGQLEQVVFVMKGGEIIRGQMRP